MAVIDLAVLVSAVSKRLRWLVTGSLVRAVCSRLVISARISAGSASRWVMWSQTRVSR